MIQYEAEQPQPSWVHPVPPVPFVLSRSIVKLGLGYTAFSPQTFLSDKQHFLESKMDFTAANLTSA